MKKLLKLMLVMSVLLSLSGEVFARYGQGRGQGQCRLDPSMPATELSEAQTNSLIFMLEEEKLARDVYITMYKKYKIRVFNNISRSEQKHMDAVKTLLDRRSIDYSIDEDSIGVFKNEDLQKLYNTLVDRGNQSIKDALQVGYDIEVIDIQDLEELVEGMPEDVTFVFGNLTRASYNHKDAFERNLSRY
jgi:hypothetical protein